MHWGKALVAMAFGLVIGLMVLGGLYISRVADAPAAVASADRRAEEPAEGAAPPSSPRRELEPDQKLQPILPRDPEGALAYRPMEPPSVARPTIGPDGGMRVIALCEPGFRAHHEDWQAVASSRIEGAADILWNELGIDLVEAAPALEWEPPGDDDEIVGLLNGLGPYVPDILEETGARYLIGMAVSRSPDAKGLCGLSRVLTDHCVVLEVAGSRMPERFYQVTIAHEIGHCFGAFHSPEPDSIMIPRLLDSIPTRFDEANKRIIEMTRHIDLSAGEEAMDEDTLVEMAELTKRSMVPGDHNGAADQIARRAYRALKRKSFEEGERLCRLALKYGPNLWETHANLAYSLLRQGEREEARAALQTAIDGDPGLWEHPNIRELSDALLIRDIPEAKGSAERLQPKGTETP
jgi:tetratricopeptide (TPR) repeat protein